MEVTESNIEGLSREFKVAVSAADVEQKIANRLTELARSVKLPGFRPGKVPVSLLRKRYGDALKGEVLEETVKESSATVISERGLRPAAQPKIEITSFDDGGDLEYTMAIDLLPEIDPPDYPKIELEKLVAEPDETDVDETLQRLAEAHKTSISVTEKRPAKEGDILVIDFVGRIGDEPFEGGAAENHELTLGSKQFIPGFEDQLIGASAGECKEISVTFPDDYGSVNLAGKLATFDVKVHEIREGVPADVDDELAKKIGIDSLEALKTEIREQHSRELKTMSRLHMKRSLLDKLADMYDFAPPQSMVDREYESIVGQIKEKEAGETRVHDHDNEGHDHGHEHNHGHDGHDHDHTHDHDHDHEDHQHDHKPHENVDAFLTDEQRTEYRGIAQRRVRLGLVLAEVGRVNNLRVSEEELNKAIMSEASRFPGQEKVFFDYFRQNPSARDALAAPILEDKVVDFMLEMATVKDRDVPAKELFETGEDTESAAL
jgi:trigger factor